MCSLFGKALLVSLCMGLLVTVLVVSVARAAGEGGVAGLRELTSREEAPEIALRSVEGGDVSLSALKGQVVVVNFWASWCPPCRYEMPHLERLWQRLSAEPFRLLAVGVGEDVASIDRFYHSLSRPLTFTLLPDLNNRVSPKWPLSGLPTTFIVDNRGRIAYVADGVIPWDHPAVEAVVRRLLAEGQVAAASSGSASVGRTR